VAKKIRLQHGKEMMGKSFKKFIEENKDKCPVENTDGS